MPDPVRMLRTLERARAATLATPGRRGHVVDIPSEVFVVGDLHGNLRNLQQALAHADLKTHRKRHLVLQEVLHGPMDRLALEGDRSHRLLDLVAALKVEFPERVHFLLGNHELAQWTGRAIVKDDLELNGLFREGLKRSYGAHAEALEKAYGAFFDVCPAAIRTASRVLICHSLPAPRYRDKFRWTDLYREYWQPEDLRPGGVLYAIVWGRDPSAEQVDWLLAQADADVLITGHFPCEDGYALASDRHLILDARDERGCACLIPAAAPVAMPDLVNNVIRL
ncbi:MAG: metallophosphoesterase [Gemmataceae bacterium]